MEQIFSLMSTTGLHPVVLSLLTGPSKKIKQKPNQKIWAPQKYFNFFPAETL